MGTDRPALAGADVVHPASGEGLSRTGPSLLKDRRHRISSAGGFPQLFCDGADELSGILWCKGDVGQQLEILCVPVHLRFGVDEEDAGSVLEVNDVGGAGG